MDAVLAENLTKRYGKTEVLKGVSLKIEEGEFYALMGPNGSGKTTLVSIMTSVRVPTGGRVEVYGKTPEAAKELIGYVPQENFSSPLLTGRENLTYFARVLGHPRREAGRLVDELLGKMGLSEDADKRVAHYSGGLRKRLEVATALFPGTRILILDEPTTGLDPSARRHFFGLIQEVKDEKTTVLLITHIGADAESASKVGLIDEGRIIAEDRPEALKRASGLENVIHIETAMKSERVAGTLREFSEKGKVLETEVGYRVYCEYAERVAPEIVRSLDDLGCNVMQIETVRPSLEDVFFELTEKPLGG